MKNFKLSDSDSHNTSITSSPIESPSLIKQSHNFIFAQIYGIFSIDMNSVGVRFKNDTSIIHLVLMKNLSGVPKKYILRTYDLKGSEYSREVLKGNHQIMDLSKITMKDKDFEEVEKRVNIESKYLEEVQETMIRDVNFFQKAKLMDYSLLVMKIDWDGYVQECGGQKPRREGLCILPDVSQSKDVCYHLSIIDYFQEWNMQKKGEKLTKQIIKLNPNLDTSAQNPEVYGERFIRHVVRKVFGGD